MYRAGARSAWLALAGRARAAPPGYRAPEVQVPTAFRETRDTRPIETLVTGPAAAERQLPVARMLGDTTLDPADEATWFRPISMSGRQRRGCAAPARPGPRRRSTLRRRSPSPAATPGSSSPAQPFPSRRRRVPGPEHLGRRVRCLLGAGPVWPGTAQRAGAGRVCGACAGGPARHSGVRSPPTWPGPTSSCAAPRSSSRWRSGMRENQRRTLQVTRQRLDAGRGTAFDTERAQAQLSFTLASIPLLESRVRQAQYQIGVLVGRPPAAVAVELEPVAALPTLPPAVSVASPRLGGPSEARCRCGRAPARGGARAGGGGESGLPATAHCWRKRRLLRDRGRCTR